MFAKDKFIEDLQHALSQYKHRHKQLRDEIDQIIRNFDNGEYNRCPACLEPDCQGCEDDEVEDDEWCAFHEIGSGICTCDKEICKDCNKDIHRCSCKVFNPW